MPVSITDPANGKTKLEILNTNDYERKTIYIIIFLLVTISGKAQDFNPGPEAQNLTERKNVTVDYATGLFHYTVPLYQLKSGDYELPISLDYIAKGVKVSDPEGLIGQNWTLNVGGIVTRTIRGGFADEKSGYGYLWTEMLLLHWNRMQGLWGFVNGMGKAIFLLSCSMGRRWILSSV